MIKNTFALFGILVFIYTAGYGFTPGLLQRTGLPVPYAYADWEDFRPCFSGFTAKDGTGYWTACSANQTILELARQGRDREANRFNLTREEAESGMLFKGDLPRNLAGQ